MIVGGFLGIFFVTLLRRVMVEDQDLPFPESTAAAEIHKAGQRGLGAAMDLVWAMIVGCLVFLGGQAKLFTASRNFIIHIGELGKSMIPGIKFGGNDRFPREGPRRSMRPPSAPPTSASGYIIGPELGALNFAGGLLAWGLFVPLLMYFLGPQIAEKAAAAGVKVDDAFWSAQVLDVWRFIVRPIAVGGMLVGAATTLYKMRKNLGQGHGPRRQGPEGQRRGRGGHQPSRPRHGHAGRLRRPWRCCRGMIAVYFWFSRSITAAVIAAIVMAITGFFFAAVSGNLVGLIGSSNNPISGLTLSTLLIAALLTGRHRQVKREAVGLAVAAVLGVAAVVCISSAVAGEMLQDLKVGHLLGGTPSKMQWGDILGILVAGSVMYFPLLWLYQANMRGGPASAAKSSPRRRPA